MVSHHLKHPFCAGHPLIHNNTNSRRRITRMTHASPLLVCYTWGGARSFFNCFALLCSLKCLKYIDIKYYQYSDFFISIMYTKMWSHFFKTEFTYWFILNSYSMHILTWMSISCSVSTPKNVLFPSKIWFFHSSQIALS